MVKIISTESDETAKPAVPATPRVRVVSTEADLDGIIARAAEKYKVDPLLIRAMIQQESGGNARAVGPETAAQPGLRASGLMQLMPGTAKDMGVTDVFDPEQNIMGGTRYLRTLLDREDVKGNVPKALLYYVGGRDPKNWGQQSFAYPYIVLEDYRKRGGRLMDPEVSDVGFVGRAASAVLPFGGMVAAAKGKGPDLSQGLSGVDANRPVGAKLKEWWNSKSPEKENWEKGLKNYADNNPGSALGADLVGGLPAMVVVGMGANALLQGAGNVLPRAAPFMNFLRGGAGQGNPLTGEGRNWLTRAASNAAQGGVQGGVTGGAFAFTDPKERGIFDNALEGAAIGAPFGVAGMVGADVGNRLLFGKRIDPEVARLGLDVQKPDGNFPGVKLEPDFGQQYNLSLDPKQFSRAVYGMVDDEMPPEIERGQLKTARRVQGEKFEGAKNLYAVADSELINGMTTLIDDFKGDPTLRQELIKIPEVRRMYETLWDVAISSGMIRGEDYLKWIKQGAKPGPVARMVQNSNPAISEAGWKIKELLDASFDRGVQEHIQILLAQGKQSEAAQVVADYAKYADGRKKWRYIKPIEDAVTMDTKEVIPSKLASGAQEIGGDLERIGRAGYTFDPSRRKAEAGFRLPYSAAAVLGSGIFNFPVHTGAAALGVLGLGALGSGARAGIASSPPYVNSLLRRSARMGPGPMQEAMRMFGTPTAVLSGRSE